MYRILAILIITLLSLSQPANAEPARLRIVSWNIADFHHKAGFEARPGIGTKRTEADFAALKKYAKIVDGDIVALQEIATPEAAQRLFPKNKYDVYMSSRYFADKKLGGENDIYTAVAIKKRSDIKFLKQEDIVGLQIDPATNDPDDRPTRRGTAVQIQVGPRKVWIVSVHLKSSCAYIKNIPKSSETSCQILWQQRLPLKEWIDQRTKNQESFILAGDYNRGFRLYGDADPLWLFLNNDNPQEPSLVKHPESAIRACPTKHGKQVQPIDWIILDSQLAQSFVPNSYREILWSTEDTNKHWRGLSDHCPIQIDLSL